MHGITREKQKERKRLKFRNDKGSLPTVGDDFLSWLFKVRAPNDRLIVFAAFEAITSKFSRIGQC